MAPDTLKILLLRWKLSLGVMGFGRDVVLPCVAAVCWMHASEG
ncbi:hypothetical protein CFP56_026259 [Quercus suber]|uniref:Uncharacterized protein n=1 Tax=Quercus suber TaxID=58331 RepID=A0AAW0K275_QUESU